MIVTSIVVLYIAVMINTFMFLALARRWTTAGGSSPPAHVPFLSLGAGTPIPQLAGTLYDGSRWSFDTIGDIAVVAIVSPSCSACRSVVRELGELAKTNPTVAVIAAFGDPHDDAVSLLGDLSPLVSAISFPSEEFSEAFSVGGTPTVYLVGANGVIQAEALTVAALLPHIETMLEKAN